MPSTEPELPAAPAPPAAAVYGSPGAGAVNTLAACLRRHPTLAGQLCGALQAAATTSPRGGAAPHVPSSPVPAQPAARVASCEADAGDLAFPDPAGPAARPASPPAAAAPPSGASRPAGSAPSAAPSGRGPAACAPGLAGSAFMPWSQQQAKRKRPAGEVEEGVREAQRLRSAASMPEAPVQTPTAPAPLAARAYSLQPRPAAAELTQALLAYQQLYSLKRRLQSASSRTTGGQACELVTEMELPAPIFQVGGLEFNVFRVMSGCTMLLSLPLPPEGGGTSGCFSWLALS